MTRIKTQDDSSLVTPESIVEGFATRLTFYLRAWTDLVQDVCAISSTGRPSKPKIPQHLSPIAAAFIFVGRYKRAALCVCVCVCVCVCTSRPELQQLSPLGDSRCSYLNNIPNSLASLTRDSPASHHRDPGVPGILFQERTNPSGSLVDPLPLLPFNDRILSERNDPYKD